VTKRKLVVGLGNIGEQYDGTRHNTGFMVLDAFAAQHSSAWQAKPKFKALITEVEVAGTKLLLAKPTTFYNLSGEAVQAILSFYKMNLNDMLVVHDELDLSFGTLRIRIGGSDAGNNGVKNISSHVGSHYTRLRIGIANEHLSASDAADFVLKQFTSTERTQLPRLTEKATEQLAAFGRHTSLQHTSIYF
jgi:PTH1 family peptidyl-tRNA hydrolase